MSLCVCICIQKYIIVCKKQWQWRTNCMLCDVSVPAMLTVGGPYPTHSIISIPALTQDMFKPDIYTKWVYINCQTWLVLSIFACSVLSTIVLLYTTVFWLFMGIWIQILMTKNDYLLTIWQLTIWKPNRLNQYQDPTTLHKDEWMILNATVVVYINHLNTFSCVRTYAKTFNKVTKCL